MDEKDRTWIPVQDGLFEYPPADGRKPSLLANQCKKCGRTFFPKRFLCPHCSEEGELLEVMLDTRCIIYASTVVHIPSPAGIEAPYAYGYVDIPANNIRIFALFTGDEPYSFAPGREVELVLEPIGVNEKGQQLIGHQFRPAP
jgi:uncharacterized OB-fold protein